MWWVTWAIALAVSVIAFVVLSVLLARRLSRRDPYRSFLRLRTRQKVRFLKALLTDRRVPLVAKLVPVLLVAYLAMPIDIIPDFIPILGYLDDVAIVMVALVLFIWLCPRPVVRELLAACAQDSPRGR